MDSAKRTFLSVGFVIIAILIFLIFFSSFAIVDAGNVGVITRLGAVNRVVNPGLTFKIPLIEGIAIMETRTQKEQVDAQAASKDLQEVKSTIALNFHLNGEKAVTVYQNVGTEYKDRIIAPAMQEAFKATTAQFTASELIEKREKVKQLAYNGLRERLSKYDIVVDDFNIVNFEFSADFNQAIEQKQVAQQNFERAKTEAQTAVTQANGQAEAQKALRDNGSLTPEYLEFLAIQKWDGKLPNATSGTPFINIPTH
ncbi:MAG TPA: prohibitin family protein [Patescibacteria group bacterium]|nr:prohibitin family protein [Patescibacteria group bacterium]